MVGFGFYGCLQTIQHAAGCQMRTKNNVHNNSITRRNDRTRYAHRDDTVSAARCLECTSLKWMSLRTWIVWEIWYHRLTDRPTARVPWADHRGRRAGGLDHPTHQHARPRWSAQGTRAVGRSVSRWYQIWHAIQVRRFIHLGDAYSKQWAALNASVSIPRWRTWKHPRSTPAAFLRVRLIVEILRYYVRYFSSVSGNLPHVVMFVNK